MKKKLLLFLALLFPSICSSNETPAKVFIMLSVNNTLADKIYSSKKVKSSEYASKLKQKGISVQSFEFYSIKDQDPLFKYYKSQKNKKLTVNIESEDKIKISEMIAIRPSMAMLLRELTKLDETVHILICSNNQSNRVKSLVESIKLTINNKPFYNVVDFVPRDNFRVKISSSKNEKTIAKSAWELRKNYNGKFGRINSNDYIISIGQLSDNQFIYSNPKKDLNIYIPPFYTDPSKLFDLHNNKNNMLTVVKTIKDFIRQ